MSTYVRVEEPARHIAAEIRQAVRSAFKSEPALTYAELAARFCLTKRQVRHAICDLRASDRRPRHDH